MSKSIWALVFLIGIIQGCGQQSAPAPQSHFQKILLETPTIFKSKSAGTWCFANYAAASDAPDLVYINTGASRVHVQIASAASKYQTLILDTATVFTDGNDGVFSIPYRSDKGNPDMYFIKTKNTASHHVELMVASAASQYATKTLDVSTALLNDKNATWCLIPRSTGLPDLACIKATKTPDTHVELLIASAASNYKTISVDASTTFVSETDGVWSAVPEWKDAPPDVYFVKWDKTADGHMAVWDATGESTYMVQAFEASTAFPEETDGTWCLIPHLNGNVPDLAFIQTGKTPSGKVEVHIASGKE